MMQILSKKGWMTLLFFLLVLIEVLFFFFDVLHIFNRTSQQDIARLIEFKKNATMSIAITAAHFVEPANLSHARLKMLSQELYRHTDFKNIWFKIVDGQGQILWSSIPVVNRNFYKELPWNRQFFSDFIMDCKGVHIASFAPIDSRNFHGFFGVISQFNSIQRELAKIGIDSVTVVDRKLKERAFGIYEAIDGYKVVNLSPKKRFLLLLRRLDLQKLLDSDFVLFDGMFIGKFPLQTLKGEVVGWIFYAKSLSSIIYDIFYKRVFFYVGIFFFFLIGYVTMLYRLFYKEQERVGKYYKKILEHLGEIVFITNGEKILYANKKFYDYFSKDTRCICSYFVKEEGFVSKEEWKAFLQKEGEGRAKVQIGNQEYILLVRATKIAAKEYSVVMIDMTQQYYYEKSLEMKALKDPLTGLYNRYMLIHTFFRLKEESKIEGSEILLVIFDIDHFKRINDTYGHDRGDFVLAELAKIMGSFFRSEDMLFRIGGEEFLLLLKTKDVQKILNQLEKVKESVAKHDFDGIRLTISMGVAKWCGESFEVLFKKADQALYRSKREGRNRISYVGECA